MESVDPAAHRRGMSCSTDLLASHLGVASFALQEGFAGNLPVNQRSGTGAQVLKHRKGNAPHRNMDCRAMFPDSRSRADGQCEFFAVLNKIWDHPRISPGLDSPPRHKTCQYGIKADPKMSSSRLVSSAVAKSAGIFH